MTQGVRGLQLLTLLALPGFRERAQSSGVRAEHCDPPPASPQARPFPLGALMHSPSLSAPALGYSITDQPSPLMGD